MRFRVSKFHQLDISVVKDKGRTEIWNVNKEIEKSAVKLADYMDANSSTIFNTLLVKKLTEILLSEKAGS